jgi:hypothetical protein
MRIMGPFLMVVGFILMACSQIPSPMPCYYGPLNNGGISYGITDKGKTIPNTTMTSTNGLQSIKQFNFIWTNFIDTSHICFFPRPRLVSNPSFQTFNIWMFYLAVLLETFGMLFAIVVGIYDYQGWREEVS